MFKTQYHCLVAGLPDLIVDGNKALISLNQFKEELKVYLTPQDYKLVEVLFYEFDNTNILSFLRKENFDWNINGNYSREFIESQIKTPDNLIKYIFDFLTERLENDETSVDLYSEFSLSEKYYSFLLSLPNKFLSEWFEYEMNLININTALLRRKYKLPLDGQIIGKNEVSQLILTSQSKDFELGNHIKGIDSLIALYESASVIERELKLDQLRWDYLTEKTVFEYFSIEKVLSYTIMFKIASRWHTLNTNTGKKILENLLDGLASDFKIPIEFNQ